MKTKDVYYEKFAEERFDPIDDDTILLERKLIENGLASAKPIGYSGLSPGTVGIRLKNETVLVRSIHNGETFEIFGAATAGKKMDQLIKKIAGR